MSLDKLKIHAEKKKDSYEENYLTALFNPSQISFQKTSSWSTQRKSRSDTGETQFTGGQPVTLSLELFFDTYAEQKDVRDYTRKLMLLTRVNGDLHRPPRCVLIWGKFHISSDYHSSWVLTSLNQTYTLFLEDGTPARATAACSFRQWIGTEDEQKWINLTSPDVTKTHVVQRGETLSDIALRYYDDPSLWRPIADENRIINPRLLEPGRRLIIPVLRLKSKG